MTLNTDRLSKATSRKEDMTVWVQNKLPRVESGNLFNQAQSPSLNWISETVQPSVSTISENINLLSPTNIPTINKEIRQTALKLWGTYLENQRNLMMNTAQYALEQLWLNFNYMWQTQAKDVAKAFTIGSEALEKWRQSVQESKFMKWINKVLENTLWKEWAEVAKNIYSVTSPSWMVLKWNELLSWLLNKAGISAQSIEKEYQKDLDETLWWQRREKETISQNIKQWDIPWITWNVWWQLWYMAPSIMATWLWWKAAWLTVLFPSMFQEAYDRYIQIEWITDNEAFIAATIVWLLNSAVEMWFWLEDMVAGKWVSWFLTKLIKTPVLKYLTKMWINIWWEWLEEWLQRVFEDIWAYMLWEPSEFETVWEYLKNVLNVDIKEWSIMSALLLWIPSHVSVTREIKRERSLDSILDELDKWITENLEDVDKRATDINKAMEDIFTRDSMLYDLAENEGTYEEFLEDAKGYADEELLQSIWNTVKWKPKVGTEISDIDVSTEEWLEWLEDIEDIEYEEEWLEESVTWEEITQTERDMDLITEFINQAEEHFNQKLAQEQNKTLEDVKRQQQELKDFELSEQQTEQINNALSNLALTVDTKTLREAWIKDNVPKIVDWRYVRPKIFDSLKQWTIWEWVKPEATRKETEQQYYKTVKQLNEARNQRRALISLINNLNKTLDTKKVNDMINEVNDAMWWNLIWKNILLSDLKNWNIVGAAFKARAMVNDWNKVIKKLKARADRQAWKYIYRLHSESVDNQLIWFSTFSLKHKLKTRPTETKYINMIQSALKKMSKVFNLDMSKVFEWCHVIFLDYGGSSRKQAWWSMEWFVDWNWTPVIPISLNYVWWKESTVIHELMHWLDFIYQYRNWWVSFVENDWLMYSADFLYTLNQELPWLYKKLLNELTYWSGRKWYWTKPTEVMSRIFQEYYEYYVLNQTNTVNDIWHWKDITVVKDAVNKLTDLFREEFGRNPVINWTETVEEYNRKIDDMVNKFNSENTWKFLEMIEKVWLDKKYVSGKLEELGNKLKWWEIDWDTYIKEAWELNEQQQKEIEDKIWVRKEKIKKAWEQLKWLREKTEEAQSVDEVIRYAIMMSDLEFQWDMLMELWQDFTDVMLWTRWELSDLWIEAEKYNDTVQEAKKYIEEFDLANKAKTYTEKYNKRKEELLDKLADLYNNSLVGKWKTKKWFKKRIEKVLYVLARTSDRLLNISPRIWAALMEMEVKTWIMTAKYWRIARPFFKKLRKLTKAQQKEFHKLVIDFWDTTSDTTLWREKLLKFVDKYWLRKEFDIVSDMLKAIRDEAIGAWLKIEDRENYFPRNVKDYDWLMEYLNKMIKEWKWDVDYTEETELLWQLQKAISDTNLTEEQKQRRIRNVLTDLSWKFNKKVSTMSSHQEKRTITWTKDWWEWLLKFYDTPDVALAKYIEDMAWRIERAKFFGMWVEAEWINDIYTEVKNLWLKLNDNLREDIRLYILWEKDAIVNLVRDVVEQWKDYDSSVDIVAQLIAKMNDIYERDTDTSITWALSKWIKEWWITPDNLEEVRWLLKSYFDSRATSEWAAAIQALGSLVFLSDIRNTLTQTADIWFTIAQWGLIKPVADVILRNNWINVDVLWIEDPREELKVDNGVGKVTSKTLKATWFKTFDMFFKNTFLDQVFRSMCKQARSRFKWKQKVLETRLNALWWIEKAKQILKIYKEWKLPLTEDWALILEEAMPVLVDCACELWNTQPIYKSSRTQYYNDADMGRNWYNLKTYPLSLLNRWFWSTKRKFKYMRDAGYWVAKAWKYAAGFLISNMIIMTISEVFAWEIKNLWDTIPYWLYQLAWKWSDDDKEWKETILYTWLNKWSKEAGELIWDNFKEQLAWMFLFNRYSKTAWNIYWGKWVIMEQLPPILETVTELVKIILWTYNRIVWENVFADVKNPAIWSRRVPWIWSLIYQSWWKEYAKEHKDVEKIKEKKGREDKSSNKYNINF